ncbi:flavin monoamine oxidase family protein [Paracoccus zhejiangensis]|nr:flavin monoamine oxidase family protein [Paracoccus zhejiangensis]
MSPFGTMSRRSLLTLIGATAGSAAMLRAMTTMGHAQESDYKPVKLEGDPKGASVVILGAGLAGMTAALELRDAGYKVTILEYQKRAGGRCITLRGGDEVHEMGGFVQKVGFSEGQFFNNGPWRIPHHHQGVIHYCQRLGVALQPFVQENLSAYLHSKDAFDGKPQRQSWIKADYQGHVTELLTKAVNAGALDDEVTGETKDMLLESLREYGALDKDMRYASNIGTSNLRGYDKPAGGGMTSAPVPSTPIGRDDLLRSGLWHHLREHDIYEHHAPLFQPIGGMDMIARGFANEVGDLITYDARVTRIAQSETGVTIDYDSSSGEGEGGQVTADYCVCTIPFSVLGQIEADLSSDLQNAVDTVWYYEGFKAGLEMKRRFWEQDEKIYGGITFTDLSIGQISYPSADMMSAGPGVLLGAYQFGKPAYEFTALTPEQRIERCLADGEKIHGPNYRQEFTAGASFGWHRNSWTLGCYGHWDEYGDTFFKACEVDRRLVCAGEHLSQWPGWQEGAILSALDAITRLHQRVIAG